MVVGVDPGEAGADKAKAMMKAANDAQAAYEKALGNAGKR